ncbi:hypothetical protein LIA77_02768 [Sarocladium implicatum]|nr:hypothetical protein LIA77_02768 [Sarocladium implicatum]
MKTGTVAIVASCLLGQAIAAPASLIVRSDNAPKDVGTDGTDVVGSIGPDGGSLSGSFKNGIGHSERGIEGTDIDSLVKAIAPVLNTAGGAASGAAAAINSKRSLEADQIFALFRNLAPVLDNAGKAASGAADTMSNMKRAVDPAQIDALLKLLAPVMDTAGGVASEAANSMASKRALDPAQIDALLKTLAPVVETAGGVASAAADSMASKRALDPAQIDALLKTLAPVMETAGGVASAAADSMASKRAVDPAQIDALLKLLAPVMETAGGVASDAAQSMAAKRALDPAQVDTLLRALAPVLDTAGKTATGAAESLGKRETGDKSQSKNNNQNTLLFGNLGNLGATPKDIETITDQVNQDIVANGPGTSTASENGGLGKRNLLKDLGITDLLATLSTGMGDITEAEDEAKAAAQGAKGEAKGEAYKAIADAMDMTLDATSEASNAAGLGLVDSLAKQLGLYDTVGNAAKATVGGVSDGLAKRGLPVDASTFLAVLAPVLDQLDNADVGINEDAASKTETAETKAGDATVEKREALSLDPATVLELLGPFVDQLKDIHGEEDEEVSPAGSKREALPLDAGSLLGPVKAVLGQLQNVDVGINEPAGGVQGADSETTTSSKRGLLSGGFDPTTILAALDPLLGNAVDLDTGKKKDEAAVQPETESANPNATVGKRSLSDLIALFKALGPLIEQLRDREPFPTKTEPTTTPTPGSTTDLAQLLSLPTLL